MSMAPLGRLRGLVQALGACCLLGAPLFYVFEVKTAEMEGMRISRANRQPVVRHAWVTTNLNDKHEALAFIAGEADPIVISAPPDAPTELKDQTVLVFYSTWRNCWRFISDRPEYLSASAEIWIEDHHAPQIEVAQAARF
jgi:hypothetical protein